MSSAPREIFTARGRRVAFVVFVLGLAASGAGIVAAPARAWTAWLAAAFLWISVAFGASALLALAHLSKAAWIVPLKRVPEALSAWLPVGALTLLGVIFGLRSVYEWSEPEAAHDPVLAGKHAWLNVPAFAARMAIVLAIWIALTFALRRESRAQDHDHDVAHTRRTVALSAAFAVVGALTFSAASVDWLMSAQPHWQSTIFGFYQISGALVAGVSGVTMTTIVLRRRGLLPHVHENHLHDLGKLLFAFSTLWAYMWLSQYLLVWYANIPEETSFFLARTTRGWGFVFWGQLVVGWLVPFFVLMSREAKRTEGVLLAMSAMLLVGRWLDVWLAVAPPTMPDHPGIGVLELAPFLAIGAALLLVVERALRTAPLTPEGDPYFEEGAHQHG